MRPAGDNVIPGPAHLKAQLSEFFEDLNRIQTTPYVCNERIFGGPLFTFNKIFLKDPLSRFVGLTFTLLLAPFESKLSNN